MKTLILALGIAIATPFSVHAEAVGSKILAERYLDEGRMELKRNRPASGELAFRKAATFDPLDPMPHYLLANLLARSDRHVDAIEEYKMSLRVDPKSSVAGYCRQALGAYKLTLFGEAAGSQGAYIPPPPPTELETAIDSIDRQSQFEKLKEQKFASDLATSAVKGGAWKARDIKLTGESDVANMYAQARPTRGKYSSTQHADAEAARIRADAERRATIEQELAKERADNHTSWVRERQMEIDNTAGNLKEQLTERPSKFGFDLAPTGTGLYVRNYKSSKPQKKLPDPRFSVLRLTEPGIHDGD